jgi:hypothetical protein
VDIRLLARQFKYANETDQSELIDQCKLTRYIVCMFQKDHTSSNPILVSYAEFNAPKIHVANKSNMILSDITFINKKRYLYEDALISVNHIEQQDKRAKRTELTVSILLIGSINTDLNNFL